MPVYIKVTGFCYFVHSHVYVQVKAANRKSSVVLMGPHESREGEILYFIISRSAAHFNHKAIGKD